MNRRLEGAARALAVLTLLTTAGCAGMPMNDVLGGLGGMGGSANQVRGEIGRVDERNREIELRGGWGRNSRVRYDNNTDVVYGQRRYDVRDLEKGDVVSIQVQQDRRGEMYADRIYVEQSARGGRGGSRPRADRQNARLATFEGRVAQVDQRRGLFTLAARNGGGYTVSLPHDPSSSLRKRFQRLRRGDIVRVEGMRLRDNRVELRRFR